MWLLLPPRLRLAVVIATSMVTLAGLQAATDWRTGEEVPAYKLVSAVVFIVGTVLVFVANAAWRPLWKRWPVLGSLIYPDLNGTWTGTLVTSWDDGSEPRQITIWVKQSLFSTSVRSATVEGGAKSTRVFLEADRDAEDFAIWYSYRGTPNGQLRRRSPEHEGVCRLELAAGPDQRLTGSYFTSRHTSGHLDVTRVSPDRVAEQAQ